MGTILQKRLAQEIVKDIKAKKPRNKKDLLVSAGYGVVTAEATPERTIAQKGVQEELKDLGFTTEGADSVVKSILYNGKKEENKLKAADMIYKRLGDYKDTDQGAAKTLVINITGVAADKYGIDPRPSASNS